MLTHEIFNIILKYVHFVEYRPQAPNKSIAEMSSLFYRQISSYNCRYLGRMMTPHERIQPQVNTDL